MVQLCLIRQAPFPIAAWDQRERLDGCVNSCDQEKNEALRAANEAVSRGGNANEARLHDQQAYIASLQVRQC